MKTYTFHVSLPGTGRTWRKLELSAEQTLEDLHFAIQDAFDWDADHMYSFFMSGKAWDASTEYQGPEYALEDDWTFEEDDEEGEDEAGDAAEGGFAAATRRVANDLSGELPDDMPSTPEERQAFLDNIKSMSSAEQAQLADALQRELGLPSFLTDALFSMLRTVDDAEMLGPLFGDGEGLDVGEPGAGWNTTLESLDLHKGRQFMYLFDYGDEWRFKVKVSAINPNAPDDREYPFLVESVGDAPLQYPDWVEEADEEEEDS